MSNKPKYTSGPWEAAKQDDCGWDIISSDLNTVVGDCGVFKEADARLITAAPDLLEAAKEALEIVKLDFGTDHAEASFPNLIEAVRKAEHANL